MIARISGTLISKSASYVVVDTQGIGYRVFVPLTTFYELPDIGQSVTLQIYTQVKQDAIHLYGFNTMGEREIFQLMISVSGIGPKLGMNILSGISGEDLVRAISEGNLNRLIRVPGVGRKMAERILLELKEKILTLDIPISLIGRDRRAEEFDPIREDALSALVNLGYKKQIAYDVLDRVIKDQGGAVPLDILLKNSLKILSG